MRRRSRKALWSVVLLVLAVGVFMRGRSDTASQPAATSPSQRSIESPAENRVQPDFRISKPVAAPERVQVQPASRRNDRQLQLRVVGVHDGDTITGLDDTKTQHKIRLDAIDAPELGQPFGQVAKKALSEKVFGKDVVVIPKTTDKYGRTVGHVLIDGRDMNLEMLKEGMAWHYAKYDRNKRLADAEQQARADRLGLWVDSEPVAPWDWRSRRKRGR